MKSFWKIHTTSEIGFTCEKRTATAVASATGAQQTRNYCCMRVLNGQIIVNVLALNKLCRVAEQVYSLCIYIITYYIYLLSLNTRFLVPEKSSKTHTRPLSAHPLQQYVRVWTAINPHVPWTEAAFLISISIHFLPNTQLDNLPGACRCALPVWYAVCLFNYEPDTYRTESE